MWLALETLVTSIWWGSLVRQGGSIWLAVMLHDVVNTIVAVQGLRIPMVEPVALAYRQILWFSMPLGVLGIWLII